MIAFYYIVTYFLHSLERAAASIGRAPGFLAGPSGIRAGWVLETKSRLGAE